MTANHKEPRILTAYRGAQPDCLPVWFMRQAGRSLPEYRVARGTSTLLEACLNPDLACEITLQPVRRYGVDAAILFSDIVVPLKLAGVAIDILPGVGPVLECPLDADGIGKLLNASENRDCAVGYDSSETADLGEFEIISEITRQTVRELNGVPLIGFAGAPYTLACYMIEGGPSRTHMKARAMMHCDRALWQQIMTAAARLSGRFLAAQIAGGAGAVQLFDSWVGALSKRDYEEYVAPFSKMTIDIALSIYHKKTDFLDQDAAVKPETKPASNSEPPNGEHSNSEHRVSIIYFAANSGHLLTAIYKTGVNVISVDWIKPLDEASETLGHHIPLQGNINPAMLFAPWEVLKKHVLDVIQRGRCAPAHILNLGHGVPPEASFDVLAKIVDLAHEINLQDSRNI